MSRTPATTRRPSPRPSCGSRSRGKRRPTHRRRSVDRAPVRCSLARVRVFRVPAAVLLLAVFLVVGPVAESARGKSGADKAVQLTVAASGDMLIHEPVWERARANGGGGQYDFR